MPYLDLDTWPRRHLFEYFLSYEQPYFNVTAPIDVTRLWHACKRDPSFSFAAAYHYATLVVVNEIECLRYRLRGDRVLVHEIIHGGTTVLLDDDTFTFCYFDYDPDYDEFQAGMRTSVQAARSRLLPFDPKDDRDDLIHCTSMPWVAFTGARHAWKPFPGDSIPKLAFGKCHESEGRFKLPVAIDVHHALVDGVHVGRFFERLEDVTSNVIRET